MSEQPWIPVEEILPEPWQLVWVWTDYQPSDWFLQKVNGAVRLQWATLRILQACVDPEGDWHLQHIGFLPLTNYYREPVRPEAQGISRPIHPLFWMPMPSAPPGQSYPPLKRAKPPGEQRSPAAAPSDCPSINDHDQEMFDDLRRYNLRHPGIVAATVVRIMKLDRVTSAQIGAARTEWLKLGLEKLKPTADAHR